MSRGINEFDRVHSLKYDGTISLPPSLSLTCFCPILSLLPTVVFFYVVPSSEFRNLLSRSSM